VEQKILMCLINAAEEDYRKFTSKLLPGVSNILGVRLPKLRKLAKEILKGDWHTYLKTADSFYLEETMLKGMVIGYLDSDIDEILRYVKEFVPKIDNWSVCDSFCSGLKITRKNQEIVWDFLQQYIFSEKEFEVRFAVVMLLNYYMEEQYIQRVLGILGSIRHDGYYVKMAVAWALSICFIKKPEPTLAFFKSVKLDTFTYNKALQKITESNVIDKETKHMIKSMKIK